MVAKQNHVLQANARPAGMLRQLNRLFPGMFQSVAEPPLHSNGNTTVVCATTKVSGWVCMLLKS